MSKKSTKKTKTFSVPRAMAEIQAAYNQLCASAGQLQYQMRIYTRELEQINTKLEAINNEAAARNQLDAQTTAKETANKSTEVAQMPVPKGADKAAAVIAQSQAGGLV